MCVYKTNICFPMNRISNFWLVILMFLHSILLSRNKYSNPAVEVWFPLSSPPPAPRFPPPHNIASSCVMLLRPSGLCRAFVYTSHLHTWRPNVHMHTIFKCVAPGHFLDPGSPALDSGFRGSCDLSREGSRRCSGRWIHWSRSRHEWSPEAVSCLGAVEGGSKAPRDL